MISKQELWQAVVVAGIRNGHNAQWSTEDADRVVGEFEKRFSRPANQWMGEDIQPTTQPVVDQKRG